MDLKCGWPKNLIENTSIFVSPPLLNGCQYLKKQTKQSKLCFLQQHTTQGLKMECHQLCHTKELNNSGILVTTNFDGFLYLLEQALHLGQKKY